MSLPEADIGPKSSLTYILYSSTSDGRVHDPETQRIVRKRAFHASREQSAAALALPTRPLPNNNGRNRFSLAKGKGRFRLATKKEKKEHDQHVAEVKIQTPRRISTLNPLIKNLGDDSWTILEYYHNSFRQNSRAINVEQDWLLFTLSDKVTAHAQLALVAISMQLESGVSAAMLGFKHRAMAANLLNEKLQEISSVSNDSVLGAIALLLIVECLQGAVQSAAVHYHGLMTILDIRRKKESAVVRQKSLERVVKWALRCYLIRCCNWESSPGLDTKLPSPAAAELPKHPVTSEIEARISDTQDFGQVIPPKLATIVDDLREIAAVAVAVDVRNLNYRLWMSTKIFDVEHKLILLHEGNRDFYTGFYSEDVRCYTNNGTITRIVLLAAKVFCLVVLRQIPRQSILIQKHGQKLANELRHIRMCQKDIVGTPEMFLRGVLLVWADALAYVSCGRISSQETDIIPHFKGLITSLNIKSYQQMMNAIGFVCWLQGDFEQELVSLWAEATLNTDREATES